MGEVGKLLRLVPLAPTVHHIGRELEVALREEIHRAELASMATEATRLASGVKIFDGPKARLWVPPCPVSAFKDRHYGPGEQVEIICGDTLVAHQLVRGDSSYLSWRRRWGAYISVLTKLRAQALTEEQVWEVMYELFPWVYGVMACCRIQIDGEVHVLCGIRSAALDTKNVGQMSFPAGTVNPFETLDAALRRELFHEGFVRVASSYPGWVRYNFPDCPSITFGRLMEARVQDALPKDGCFEVEGKKYIWVRQLDVAAMCAGDASAVIRRFEAQGIPIAVHEGSGRQELKIAPDARLTFQTFLGLDGYQ